jgi:hypothetical protein
MPSTIFGSSTLWSLSENTKTMTVVMMKRRVMRRGIRK